MLSNGNHYFTCPGKYKALTLAESKNKVYKTNKNKVYKPKKNKVCKTMNLGFKMLFSLKNKLFYIW